MYSKIAACFLAKASLLQERSVPVKIGEIRRFSSFALRIYCFFPFFTNSLQTKWRIASNKWWNSYLQKKLY